MLAHERPVVVRRQRHFGLGLEALDDLIGLGARESAAGRVEPAASLLERVVSSEHRSEPRAQLWRRGGYQQGCDPPVVLPERRRDWKRYAFSFRPQPNQVPTVPASASKVTQYQRMERIVTATTIAAVAVASTEGKQPIGSYRLLTRYTASSSSRHADSTAVRARASSPCRQGPTSKADHDGRTGEASRQGAAEGGHRRRGSPQSTSGTRSRRFAFGSGGRDDGTSV